LIVAKDPIASIPVTILVELPRVHIPLAIVGVPIDVDHKEYFYTLFLLYHHLLKKSLGCILF